MQNDTIRVNGEPLTWQTKVKAILGDDWVLQDEVAEERANLIDLLSETVPLQRITMIARY